MADSGFADTIRAALERGRRDGAILDGRVHDERFWDDADQALAALAAVLETTREALTNLAAVIREADDDHSDFAFVPDIIKAVGVSDVAYDGAGWYANAAAELTRRYGASHASAAVPPTTEEGLDDAS